MNNNQLKKNKHTHRAKPLVYSCSGCSNAAQTANELAVRLDRTELGEMSCIVGVGGDVPSFVRTARQADQTLVLDGCPVHCAKRCLERHEATPVIHIDLSKYGIKKQKHVDVNPNDVERLWRDVVLPAIEKLKN